MNITKTTTTTFDPGSIKYSAEREAQKQAEGVMQPIRDEIDRLIIQDGSKDDLDPRAGFVKVEFVQGDGYGATLEYDPETRVAKQMESELDGGSVWINEYNLGDALTPEKFSHEVLYPLANVEDNVPWSVNADNKTTVMKNKNGTLSIIEEHNIRP